MNFLDKLVLRLNFKKDNSPVNKNKAVIRGNGNVVTQTVNYNKEENLGVSQLELFEKYIIDKDNWIREFIDNKKIWIYKKDNLYQIHELDDSENFSEPWTQVYPDKKGSWKHSVDLKYSGVTIKRFISVSFDGGRETAILLQMHTNSKENPWGGKDIYGGSYKNCTYYWERNSMDYKLTDLIGSDPKTISRRSKIEIK